MGLIRGWLFGKLGGPDRLERYVLKLTPKRAGLIPKEFYREMADFIWEAAELSSKLGNGYVANINRDGLKFTADHIANILPVLYSSNRSERRYYQDQFDIISRRYRQSNLMISSENIMEKLEKHDIIY